MQPMPAHQHAKTRDQKPPRQRPPWVVGATAALLLIGVIDPAGARDTTTASEHAAARTAITAHADGGGGLMAMGCIPGLNCGCIPHRTC